MDDGNGAAIVYDSSSAFLLNTTPILIDRGSATAGTTVTGGSAGDLIIGGNAADLISGGGGNDTLSGGAGADHLDLGAGDDRAVVASSHISTLAETMAGGLGNDVIELTGGGTFDLSMADISGIETLSTSGDSAFSITVGNGLTAAGATTVIDAQSITTATNAFTFDGSAETDGAFSITGGAGDDAITGGTGGDAITGGAGDDAIAGGAGDDTVRGTAADLAGDTITDFALGDSLVVVGSDQSSLAGTAATSTLSLGGGTLTLTGLSGSHNWQATYAGGNTTLTMVARPATSGGGDSDTGSDSSTQMVDGAMVQRTIRSSPGSIPSQTVTIGIVPPTRIEQTGSPSGADIPITTTAGQTILQLQVPTGVGLQVEGDAAPRGAHQSVDDLIRTIQAHAAVPSERQALTGSGTGFLQGLARDANVIIQTVTPTAPGGIAPEQPLVIAGPYAAGVTNGVQVPVALVIDASALPSGTVIELQNVDFAVIVGAVRVTGGAGNQQVSGDGADQWVVQGADDDTLHGGGGNDFLASEGGDDVLFGDSGFDTLSGGASNDVLYGNRQDDALYGGPGADTLFGGQDADIAFGGQDSDVVYGNLGDDALYGGTGADMLYGGQGNDTLWGGQGGDVLRGGRGSDVFAIGSPGEGGDVIADFEAGVDRVAVAGPNFGSIPAGTLSASNFALGAAADADDRFVFNTTTGVLSFDADGSGAGAAVAVATLNVTALTSADILVLPG